MERSKLCKDERSCDSCDCGEESSGTSAIEGVVPTGIWPLFLLMSLRKKCMTESRRFLGRPGLNDVVERDDVVMKDITERDLGMWITVSSLEMAVMEVCVDIDFGDERIDEVWCR